MNVGTPRAQGLDGSHLLFDGRKFRLSPVSAHRSHEAIQGGRDHLRAWVLLLQCGTVLVHLVRRHGRALVVASPAVSQGMGGTRDTDRIAGLPELAVAVPVPQSEHRGPTGLVAPVEERRHVDRNHP